MEGAKTENPRAFDVMVAVELYRQRTSCGLAQALALRSVRLGRRGEAGASGLGHRRPVQVVSERRSPVQECTRA